MASLIEQREKLLREQEEAKRQKEMERYERVMLDCADFLKRDDLYEMICGYLVKNGSVDVSFGMCLCGENGCISGRKLFSMLNQKNVFDRYKKDDIEIRPLWKSFNFSLKNECFGSRQCIFEDENGELKTKYVYI